MVPRGGSGLEPPTSRPAPHSGGFWLLLWLDQAMRFSGLDVTVWSSDAKRSPGRLARRGSPVLPWALFEAAKSAARAPLPTTLTTSPCATASAAPRPVGGPQVGAPLPPHTAGAGRRGLGAALSTGRRQVGGLGESSSGIVLSGTRPRPDQLMFAAGSRQAPIAAACGGRPGKNEQPQQRRVHPIGHHVAGPPRLPPARAPR